MKTATCSNCRAEIREIETIRSGSAACPFCGEDISGLSFRDIRDATEGAPERATGRRASIRSLARRGRPVAPVAPADLTHDSGVRIEEDTLLQLRFSMPAVRHGAVRRSLTIWLAQGLAACVVFGVWIAHPFVSFFPFGFFGTLIAVGLLFVRSGRITTSVGPHEVTIRWHVGPFGKRCSVPVTAVEKVVVGEDGIRHTALVVTPDQALPLTFFHHLRTDRAVAGLVRWQLERLGHRVADE